MADLGSDLPNLKICIDNTETLSDDDDHVCEQIGSDDEGSEEGEIKDDSDDVEVNVSIKPSYSFGPKKYENKAGDFVTGFDITSEEYKKKKEERAKRFGVDVQQAETEKLDLQALYKSLGITEESIRKGERGIRPEAVHLRGVDDMSTQDIFKYFQEFSPGSVEWIDDSSCNVVWVDHITAARAVINMSSSIEDLKEIKENLRKKDEGSEVMDTEEDSTKSASKPVEESKDETMEDSDDDELNLESSDEEEEKENRKQRKKKEKEKEKGVETMDTDKPEEKTNDQIGNEMDQSEPNNDSQNKSISEHLYGADSKEYLARFPDVDKLDLPPGKWRLGMKYLKTKCLFLRYATKADKKQPGAERRSKYYVKYGNPNYGGQRGLISRSRKRRINQQRVHEEVAQIQQTVAEAAAAPQGDKPQESLEDEAMYDMLFGDDEPVIRPPPRPRKPEPRPTLQPIKRVPHSNLESRLGKKRRMRADSEEPADIFEEGELEEEEHIEKSDEDLVDEELERLLAPPKKRSMRMYADDLEEDLKKKNKSTTVSSSAGALDARSKIQERKNNAKNTDYGNVVVLDDTDDTRSISSKGTDLRSKLNKNRKKEKLAFDSPEPLTIEISRDEDDDFEDEEDEWF